MLTGVWVGYDEKRPLGDKETGGRVAAPVWLEFMQAAMGDWPVSDFALPTGITFVHINPQTGLRAAPGSGSALLECFRRGTEPQAVTEVATAPPNGGTENSMPSALASVPETVTRSAEEGF
jgi:penicillin-binding protein 1A